MPKVFGENGFMQGLEHWLAPVFESGREVAHAAAEHGAPAHHDTTMEWVLMGLSIGAALSGIFLARHIYLRMKKRGPADRRLYLPRAAQQVVRGRALRFPLRQRFLQGRRHADGEVRYAT